MVLWGTLLKYSISKIPDWNQSFQTSYACSHAYRFRFVFANPGKVTVTTEYLLYDFISTLGNVGGTLGLFIGFSFSGLISYVLNGILKIVDSMNEWIGSKKDQTKVTIVQEKSHEINKGKIVL